MLLSWRGATVSRSRLRVIDCLGVLEVTDLKVFAGRGVVCAARAYPR